MQTARRLLARAVGLFPLTPVGVVVLLGSVVALVPFGIWRGDRVLLVAGAAGLMLVVVGVVLSVLGAAWVRSSLPADAGPLELVVGHPGPTGFSVWAPLMVPLLDVRWTVHGPDVRVRLIRRGRQVVEEFTPRRRGRPEQLERWFSVGDAFGVASVDFPVPSSRPMRFLPDDGALRQVEVVRGLASGDQIAHHEGRPEGDLQDIRGYGAGDPIRFVLWKVFARTRDLVIRSPERALSPVTRTAAFLIAGLGDEAAAGTAKTAVEGGALGQSWVFGADHVAEVATDRRKALELVVRSADGPLAAAGSGLAAFLANPATERPKRVVVFAPAVAGAWVARVRAIARDTAIELVLCADAIEPAPRRLAIAPLVFLPAPEGRPGNVVVGRAALAALCRELAGVGSFKVVDRRAGKVYASSHLGKLTGAA
jgi:hypothetical protein